MPSQPQQRAPAPPTLRRDLDAIRANLKALTPVAGPNQTVLSTSDGFSIIENPKKNPQQGGDGGELLSYAYGGTGDGFAKCEATTTAEVSGYFEEYNEDYVPNGQHRATRLMNYPSTYFPTGSGYSKRCFGPVISEAFATTAPSQNHWLNLFGLYVPRWFRWKFKSDFKYDAQYDQYGYSFHVMQCPKIKVDAAGLPVWLSSQPAAHEVQFILFADEWGQPEGKPRIDWV